MAELISIPPTAIDALDLTPVSHRLQAWFGSNHLQDYEHQLGFEIAYPRPAREPDLELSELAEVRLWFIALDSRYPWLPFFLDWRNGELVRYAAMFVPHQFSPQQGIQFNPQALDIFVMQKVFVLWDWLTAQDIAAERRIRALAEMFGYELDHHFFQVLREQAK